MPAVQPPPSPLPWTPPPTIPRPRAAPPTVQPPPSPLPKVTPPQHHHPLSVLPRPPASKVRNLLPLRPSINAVLDEETGKLLEYRHLLKTKHRKVWENGFSKELARL